MDNSFELSRNEYGQLCLVQGATRIPQSVTPVRAFPISHPDESIALVDAEGRELVWLNSLAETSSENQQIIMEELASREFMPILTRIDNVSTFATPSTWEVQTSRGKTSFVLRGEDDIRRINKTMFLVSDSHGVQYLIKDILNLDKHTRRLLDRFL